ncbi:hypothetical protein ACH5RR_012798 [Cinchona calisaya]|uniref:Zinc-finger domain-containing protein n=1 Tax=Cinchona calisaya TaxID=153742 RepID=A0ABD3ABD9_9GENT
MVSTRKARRRNVTEKNGEKQEKKSDFVVKHKENSKGSSSTAAEYEEKRAQRMQENMERMKKLGILDLSKQLKSEKVSHKRKVSSTPSVPAFSDPPRRSSRLKNMSGVSYFENRTPKKGENVMKNVEIHIEKGSNPEVYTEEDVKLLGDSKTTWTLFVDGYDQEGQRIYDPFWGKSCHQCRQKTLGNRTKCSKCKAVSGQFCGDCLYMRYGENVTEANENSDWICPVCRGICNCSRCRRIKGWAPTGSIYKKVKKLGFKSVAHYLIQTCRSEAKIEDPAGENLVSTYGSLSANERDELSDAIAVGKRNANKMDRELDSDDEYMIDDSNDDFVDNDAE